MSKDFIRLVDMGIVSKEQALEAYTRSQSVFFPPHPEYVVQAILDTFKDYWAGKVDFGQTMAQRCYLRDTGALVKYFGQFIDDNDLEWEGGN